jgi:hypothetical protein
VLRQTVSELPVHSFGTNGCYPYWQIPQQYPYYYPYGHDTTQTRWKCPDCGGWVLDTVQVHHCYKYNGVITTTTANTVTVSGDPSTRVFFQKQNPETD